MHFAFLNSASSIKLEYGAHGLKRASRDFPSPLIACCRKFCCTSSGGRLASSSRLKPGWGLGFRVYVLWGPGLLRMLKGENRKSHLLATYYCWRLAQGCQIDQGYKI